MTITALAEERQEGAQNAGNPAPDGPEKDEDARMTDAALPATLPAIPSVGPEGNLSGYLSQPDPQIPDA